MSLLLNTQAPYKNPHSNLGRNDPCLCGSGRKYKKCCFDKLNYPAVAGYENNNHASSNSKVSADKPDLYGPCICGNIKKYKFCCMNKINIYSFRIKHKYLGDFYCIVELSDNDTLHDLHREIQDAYGWDDDHMYSFFMDNKFRRSNEEYSANPFGNGNTDINVKSLRLRKNQKFGYLFDYGDNHEFEIKVVSVKTTEKARHVPNFVCFGTPPEQYRNMDD